MKECLTLDDLSLIPSDISSIISRANVNTTQVLGQTKLNLPIISSNMTSVYSPKLSQHVLQNGGQSIVHRFCSIEDNIKLFKDGKVEQNGQHLQPWVSIGNGTKELERAEALISSGANTIVLDLAMGSSIIAVKQFQELVKLFPNCDIVVSDFSTKAQLQTFVLKSGNMPMAFTCGQGSGSGCSTRLKTGIGVPSGTMLTDCVQSGFNIILNGGIKNPGDACKALALGAKAVMVGRLFSACLESGAYKQFNMFTVDGNPTHAVYKGSASASSYEDQGKTASHRTPEGEKYTIPVSGTTAELMLDFNGGLRSSMSYLNANNLDEYRTNARFIQLTQTGIREASAYGKHE